ncbi:MAG TPA: hypothetical protein VIM73_03440 [Polyangiaceae bacterium]
MSEPRDRRPPQFEIPDLELPPPRPSQSGLRAVNREVLPEPSGIPPVGLELDAGELLKAGPPLELEHEGPISGPDPIAYGRAANLSADDFGVSSQSLRDAVPDVDVVWPTGVSTARERLVLDSLVIQRLAGFGEPPRTTILTPLYALRVALRRRTLMRTLRELDEQLSKAECAREELLCVLAERVKPLLAREPAFQAVLAGLPGEDQMPQRRAALVNIARSVLATRGTIRVDADLLAAIRTADADANELIKQSELHLRALDACDAERVRQGQLLLVAAVLASLAFVAWKVS